MLIVRLGLQDRSTPRASRRPRPSFRSSHERRLVSGPLHCCLAPGCPCGSRRGNLLFRMSKRSWMVSWLLIRDDTAALIGQCQPGKCVQSHSRIQNRSVDTLPWSRSATWLPDWYSQRPLRAEEESQSVLQGTFAFGTPTLGTPAHAGHPREEREPLDFPALRLHRLKVERAPWA